MLHIKIAYKTMYDVCSSAFTCPHGDEISRVRCESDGTWTRAIRNFPTMSSLPSDFFDGNAGDAGGSKRKKKIAGPSVVPVAAHRGGHRGGTTEKKKKKDDDGATAVEAEFRAELERERRAAEDAALAEADARAIERTEVEVAEQVERFDRVDELKAAAAEAREAKRARREAAAKEKRNTKTTTTGGLVDYGGSDSDESDDDDDDDDVDALVDWRAKKI